jgi:hypothetical protein
MQTENKPISKILDINKLGANGTAIRITLPTDEDHDTAELRYTHISEMDAREKARKVVRMLNNYENILSALEVSKNMFKKISVYVANEGTEEELDELDYTLKEIEEAIKEAEGE